MSSLGFGWTNELVTKFVDTFTGEDEAKQKKYVSNALTFNGLDAVQTLKNVGESLASSASAVDETARKSLNTALETFSSMLTGATPKKGGFLFKLLTKTAKPRRSRERVEGDFQQKQLERTKKQIVGKLEKNQALEEGEGASWSLTDRVGSLFEKVTSPFRKEPEAVLNLENPEELHFEPHSFEDELRHADVKEKVLDLTVDQELELVDKGTASYEEGSTLDDGAKNLIIKEIEKKASQIEDAKPFLQDLSKSKHDSEKSHSDQLKESLGMNNDGFDIAFTDKEKIEAQKKKPLPMTPREANSFFEILSERITVDPLTSDTRSAMDGKAFDLDENGKLVIVDQSQASYGPNSNLSWSVKIERIEEVRIQFLEYTKLVKLDSSGIDKDEIYTNLIVFHNYLDSCKKTIKRSEGFQSASEFFKKQEDTSFELQKMLKRKFFKEMDDFLAVISAS